MSTYEGEHTILGLFGQANLTQNDVEIRNCMQAIYLGELTKHEEGKSKGERKQKANTE
jgi:hypothetical protein